MADNNKITDPRAKASSNRGWKGYIDSGVEDRAQYAPAINSSKILQLYIGPLKKKSDLRDTKKFKWNGDSINRWDNWVLKEVNGIENCNEIVYLKAQNMEFNIDIKNKFADMSIQGALDKFSSNLGNTKTGTILKTLNGGLEMAYDIKKSAEKGEQYNDYMGALYIPKYANVKAWEGMEPIRYNFPTFTFSFGQYGLYSALEEVVKPIIAICSSFLPVPDANAKGRWQGPIPTSRAQLITIFKSLASTAMGNAQDFANDLLSNLSGSGNDSDTGSSFLDNAVGAAGSALETAIQIKDSIYGAFDTATEKLLEASSNKLAYFRLGVGSNAAIMGPFYIQGVKPSFNFQNTDINGYPTSGSITFDGVTTPLLGNAEDMDIFGLKKPQAGAAAPTSAAP